MFQKAREYKKMNILKIKNKLLGRVGIILAAVVMLTAGTAVSLSASAVYNTEDTPTKAVMNASCAGNFKIEITAKKDSTVTVYCKVKNAKAAQGLHEKLQYNISALKYISGSGSVNGQGTDYVITKPKAGVLYWCVLFDANGSDFTNETEIISFEFQALKDITPNDDVLSAEIEEFFDFDMKDYDTSKTVVHNAVSGFGTTADSVQYGDINKDNLIDAYDALLILRASVGLESFDTAETLRADVDNDGEITSYDSLCVLRYSVGLNDNSLTGQFVTAD